MRLKTGFLIMLAAAFAGSAFATRQFSDLSMDEMRRAFEDANLADDCYVNDVSPRDGYKPSGGFLDSKNVTVQSKRPDGSTVFSFNDYAGNPTKDNGSTVPSAYVYNPKNGMITPLAGDDAKKAGFDPSPPNFCAQVLEKDGTTHIAFRGSEGNVDDWVNTNIGQGLGGLPPQYVMADTLVQSVQNAGSGPIRLTGHSEGGGEVQYATLWSIARGNTDVSGSVFNYAQLSKGVKNMFPQYIQDQAGDRITYFRVGNDAVSGAPLFGDGPLSEDVHVGKAEWQGDAIGLIDPNHAGQAHRITTAISMITAAIGDKAKEDRKAKKDAEEAGNGTDNATGKKDDAKTGGDKGKDDTKKDDEKKDSDKDKEKADEDKGKDGDKDKDDAKKDDEKKDGEKGKDDAKKDDEKKDGDKDKDDAKKDEGKKDDDGKKAGSDVGGSKKGDKDKEKIDGDKDKDKDKDEDKDTDKDEDKDTDKDEDKDTDKDEDKDKDQDKDKNLADMEGGNPPSNDGPNTNADDPKGGSLGGFMEDTEIANTQKTDAGFSLNEHNTAEQRQAAENEIAKQNTDATKEQGGRDANAIKNASEIKTATDQANNSWGSGFAKEMVNISSSFGGGLGGGAGSVVGDAIQKAIQNHQNHHGGGHGGGASAGGGGQGGSDAGGHDGGGSGGKHVSSGGGGKKTGGKKDDGKHGDGKNVAKDDGKHKDDGKKSDSGGAKCIRCGVSLSKIPLAPFEKEKICEACHAEEVAEYQRQSNGGNIVCDKCGAKVSIAVNDSFGYHNLCHACEAKLLRDKAGMSSPSSSGDGKVNGTYSSSNGDGKKTEYGAYTCSMCGKKTNSIVSGVGSGVYCSNACYQKFLDSRKK